jgi:hypothetical protein
MRVTGPSSRNGCCCAILLRRLIHVVVAAVPEGEEWCAILRTFRRYCSVVHQVGRRVDSDNESITYITGGAASLLTARPWTMLVLGPPTINPAAALPILARLPSSTLNHTFNRHTTYPIMTYPILSYPVLSCPVLSCRAPYENLRRRVCSHRPRPTRIMHPATACHSRVFRPVRPRNGQGGVRGLLR